MKYLLMIAVVILSGCGTTASTYRPVVDQTNHCQDCHYGVDLAQCQKIGSDNSNVLLSSAVLAGVGAGIGAITGAIFGVDVARLAGIGALMGGVRGAADEAVTSRQMVARCMAGRGYLVLR